MYIDLQHILPCSPPVSVVSLLPRHLGLLHHQVRSNNPTSRLCYSQIPHCGARFEMPVKVLAQRPEVHGSNGVGHGHVPCSDTLSTLFLLFVSLNLYYCTRSSQLRPLYYIFLSFLHSSDIILYCSDLPLPSFPRFSCFGHCPCSSCILP